MKKNGKFLFFVAAVVMMTFAFVSCGGGSSESKTKLVYWTMWNEAEPQGMVVAEAVEAFTAETGIEVEVNFNGREIRKTLQPALMQEKLSISSMKTSNVSSIHGEIIFYR